MKLRLPRFVTRWILERICEHIERGPDQTIGPRDDPYMLRWILFKRRGWLGNIYVHDFRHDDDDRALHDHPFPSLSIVLYGKMREIYAERGWDASDPKEQSARMVKAGDVIWRSADFSHRLELLTPFATTLFIVGPKIREWGFWCPKGWKHWKEYCDPNDEGRIGPGCD
jgi:hypothetical protein